MVINKHTRVSEVIKANADSIAAIAELAKPLRKLKNPLLRRVMAPRVTLAEAAAIGGCSVADFKRVLEPLGFIFTEDEALESHPAADNQRGRPAWLLEAGDDRMVYFDVRDIIESGGDPLKEILQRYGALPPGDVLCIVNSFIPYPLINLLEKKGAQSFVETVENQLHYTWFSKGAGHGEVDRTPVADHMTMHDADSFDRVVGRYAESQVRRIDVRHLPMPLPMQTILEALPELGEGDALYVQHKRIPLHLLEALEDQPYAIHIHEVGEGDVRMLIAVGSKGSQKERLNNGRHPNR